MNAILWLLRTSCQWRNLPGEYPHWQAVYYYGVSRPCGRKREFLVDTGGRAWAVDVHSASKADGPASLPLIGDILWYGDRAEKVFGDRAYGGIFAKELSKWGIEFERAPRPESG